MAELSIPKRLGAVVHNAQQAERLAMRSMQTISRQQNTLSKATRLWGQEILRLLNTTQQRTRHASQELDRLANRAARIAAQQFLTPSQAPHYAGNPITPSASFGRAPGSPSSGAGYLERTSQQLGAQLIRNLTHNSSGL